MHDATFRRQVASLFERSPFYRDKLRAAGFSSPERISLERIAELLADDRIQAAYLGV